MQVGVWGVVLVALVACDDSTGRPAGTDAAASDAARGVGDAAGGDAAGGDAAGGDAAIVDAGGPRDGGAPDRGGADAGPLDCATAWSEPRLEVTAPDRPSAPGLRLDFAYGREGAGAFITLTSVAGEEVVRPGDGPFSVDTHAGAWVELQDAAGNPLYTRGVFELIPESLEAPPAGDSGFMRIDQCPEQGQIRVSNLANPPEATHVVLFQEAIDGRAGGPTIELARFALP